MIKQFGGYRLDEVHNPGEETFDFPLFPHVHASSLINKTAEEEFWREDVVGVVEDIVDMSVEKNYLNSNEMEVIPGSLLRIKVDSDFLAVEYPRRFNENEKNAMTGNHVAYMMNYIVMERGTPAIAYTLRPLEGLMADYVFHEDV